MLGGAGVVLELGRYDWKERAEIGGIVLAVLS